MLSVYDLYDLASIFKNIRAFPQYQLHDKVLEKTLIVLQNKTDEYVFNQFRFAISSIPSLDENMYGFAFVENYYTYFPSFIKEKEILLLLQKSCSSLLEVVKMHNTERIMDLADCLHNLPIDIAENHLHIPQFFWKTSAKQYRKKWDKNFLLYEQKALGHRGNT